MYIRKEFLYVVAFIVFFLGSIIFATNHYSKSPIGAERIRVCEAIDKKLLLVKKGDAIVYGQANEVTILVARENVENKKIASVRVPVYGLQNNVMAADIYEGMRGSGFFYVASQENVPALIDEIIGLQKKFEKQ